MSDIYLSVIIPAYNEAKRIGPTLLSLEEYFKDKQHSYEIIVVNDGSPDETVDVVRKYQSKVRNLHIIDVVENKGKGHAVNVGMTHATGKYRLFMDADNSVHISHVDEFIRQIESGYDVVIGSIALHAAHVVEHNGWYRRFFGSISKALIRNIATPGIYDTQRGFKLFTARAAEKIFPRQTIHRFGFDIELLVISKIHKFSIKELPVDFDNPEGSTVHLSDYIRTFSELFKILRNRFLGVYHDEALIYVYTRAIFSLPQNIISFVVQPFINIFSPKAHLHMKVFDEETEAKKGKGFIYKDKEFIHHTELHHTETAFYNLLYVQKVILAVALVLYSIALLVNWHITLVTTIAIITVVYFFDFLFNAFLIYRSFSHNPEIKLTQNEINSLSSVDLPTYTIFCPLYKEWQVVPQFVEAMNRLDYPTEKLHIVFLLEENDQETISKIRAQALPAHYEIIVVPHSSPKTKPKAMNYGLKYVKSDYLVIYDAEDSPEPDQLKKAVLAFQKASPQTVCIQAKLNFYNISQNLLTRMFTAEYSLWFDLVLPGLQSFNAPIPLGGTSNHFKVLALRELKGWDAFNVTEDCDLGMRLAKRGYRTAIVESTTYEEANSDVMNWYNQRSRWIKGYIQSYFVHMREPMSFVETGSIKDFIIFQLTVGGKILSMFINPLMWVVTICYFLFRAKIGLFVESFFPGPILYLGVFSLVAGNFLYLYYYMIGCAKRGYDDLIKYIFLVPIYWLGMSLAAWKAIYEVIVKPHYWSKTIHGLHLKQPSTQTPDVPAQTSEEITPAFVYEEVTQAEMPVVEIEEEEVPEVQTQEEYIVEPESEQSFDLEPAQASVFTKIKNIAFSSGGLLIISSVLANIINFLFNIYLGRKLSFEDFAELSTINTFLGILALFFSGISATVNHQIAYINAKRDISVSFSYYKKLFRKVLKVTIGITIVFIFLTPFIAQYTKIPPLTLALIILPIVAIDALSSVNSGYLQGIFLFGSVATFIFAEPAIKFLFAIFVIHFDIPDIVSFSLPISIVVSFLISTFWVFYYTKNVKPNNNVRVKFARKFYFATLLANISTIIFSSLDLVFVKHYLPSHIAGEYSLLSLIGKMIFFFGSLLNVFIISYVSRKEGERKDPHTSFYYILTGVIVMTLTSYLSLSLFGSSIVPLLLGTRALVILPYLPMYSLAISLFTIATTITLFHIARRQYVFSLIALGSSLFIIVGIILSHTTINSVIEVLLDVSVLNFIAVVILHLLLKYKKVLNDITLDSIDALKSSIVDLPQEGKKRVLIFNWRDTKHAFAGGAEVYIQEIAKRWAEDGHQITLFCGNDKQCERNEIIDGVHIVRRGGFYLVYFWAFIYYFLQFRGNFDVIIDCENGIPFFTPLYVKEPVFGLLHHVHQDIFRKYLSLPLAYTALFLEKYLMPIVYRNVPFITVSASSMRDMAELGIGRAGINIVSPGVDLNKLYPGKKSEIPLVVYMGRLKRYKSIDILINAFAQVVQKQPKALLTIAGAGDDLSYLTTLVNSRGLHNSVVFRGKISEEEKKSLLQQAWVFVNPSSMEGWGITTIEANACGTPVIASNVPGLCDSVVDNQTGILVPYGDIDAFAEKMLMIIENPSLLESFSESVVDWAKKFDWKRISIAFMNVILGEQKEDFVVSSMSISTQLSYDR